MLKLNAGNTRVTLSVTGPAAGGGGGGGGEELWPLPPQAINTDITPRHVSLIN
jgi:hypothetical protein